MSIFSSSIGSMVISYLGPCKSNKFVVDGKEVNIVKCPLLLLQSATFTDHLSYLVEETLEAHHQQFGCSTTSLLAMWYLWNEEFQLALHEGCEVSDIVEYSQRILNNAILLLPQISIDVKEFVYPKYKNCKIMAKNTCNTFTSNASMNLANLSNCVPAGIRYSSRHYSPIQINLEELKSDEETIKKSHTFKSYLENVKVNKELKHEIYSVIQKLSHDDPDCAKLVSELWIRQISIKGDLKFYSDGIIICPVTFPCSYTSVVDGVVVKSKLMSWYNQELSPKSKSLLIKGSVTFEYVHLGYNSKLHITNKLTPEEIKINEKNAWVKKCCDLLTKLKVNTVLVNGTVDTDIVIFCSSHSILLLTEIPWSTLEVISLAVKTSPCSYLLDCDDKNVCDLEVKKWNSDCNESYYFHIYVDSFNELVKPCTVILCHPNPAVLSCQEHQLWHLISRLNLATFSNSLLPGSGKTEEWASNLVKTFSSINDTEAKISSAIVRGFYNYSKIVSNKMDLKEKSCPDEALDEMQSKVQAWRCALALTILTLQCDSLIVNNSDEISVEELHSNFIGIL